MPRMKCQTYCPTCNRFFHPNNSKQKFCSRACYLPQLQIQYLNGGDVTCVKCGSSFYVPAWRIHSARFCSARCWKTRSVSIQKHCGFCKAVFFVPPSGIAQRFCCMSCARRGTVKPRSNTRVRGSREDVDFQVREWRAAVLKRDGYTCQHCGNKQHLQAHHIKEWAKFPALRFVVSNGLTLCQPCHFKVHGKSFGRVVITICPFCGSKSSGNSRSGRCRACYFTHLSQGLGFKAPRL